MSRLASPPRHNGLCPVCETVQTLQVAEVFGAGRFLACPACGVHFAETVEHDLPEYYSQVWGDGNLGIKPYEAKVAAASDPQRLAKLIDEIPRYRWAANLLRRLRPGSKVLDVGCGEGGLLWFAQQVGLEPYGCDLAPKAVALVHQLIGPDRATLGTIEDLPFEPGSLDAILALEVIEHLPSPQPFLRRAASLLKPSGLLLITTPNRYRFFAVGKRFLGRPHSNTDYPPHHYTRWTASTLGRLVAAHLGQVQVGSLPYHFEGALAQASAGVLHLLTGRQMGQSLWLIGRKG
jgi:2-polyprenyl-3-methyl-5-hydroxy-6-metoxy-1,4-benzoquinol methylase